MLSTDDAFLRGGGEMGERMRAFDWPQTSLGPIERWPQSLRTATSLILRSTVPIVMLWGPDGVMIYNDAYSVFAGGRHPRLLGSKVREGWPEVAAFNDHVMKVGLAGGTLSYKDQELTLYRHGRAEQVWMNLDYSPVYGESGEPVGVVAIVVETTERVLAERRLSSQRDRLAQMFEQAPGFMAVLAGPEHRYELANPRYLDLVGGRDVLGRSVAEALPEVVEQGFVALLDDVFRSGRPYAAAASPVALSHDGTPDDRFLDFVYQPITDSAGAVTGIFVQGVDVTERVLGERRRDVLVELTDAIGGLDDPGDIEFEAARIIARALGASRVGYGRIDPDTEILTVARDWTAPSVPSLTGTLRLREYGSFIDDLKRGETVAIADIDADPRTAGHAAAIRARRVEAFVNIPVIERGRLVAMLIVNDVTKRVWREHEIALVNEIATRTRLASERVRATAALRESEARLRFLDRLNTGIGATSSANDILAVITRMVGEHLGVSICAYADMDDDQDGFTIRGDWAAPGSRSIVGRYRLADFGRLAVETLSAGLPLVVSDNRAELAPEEAATFQSIGIGATICMPLVKEGKLTALMAIHDKGPRAWTANDLAVIREVTARSWAHVERVGAEAELRASEENFRTLARALPSHVWTAAPSGELIWFNDQVYAYTGAARGSLDGAGWLSLIHPDDVGEAASRWSEALAAAIPYSAQFRLRRADGSYRWHIARAVPIEIAGEITRWIGTNTDIQEQKETTEALADLNVTLEQRVAAEIKERTRAEEALRQSQKMEAIGQLTGGIAHDFNNLLGAISGSLSLIERRLSDGRPGAGRYIEAGQDAVRRASALTQRLLAFSRRQTLDPKPTDVNRLIDGMEELIRRTVGPDVTVEIVGAAGLWPTKIDGSQLESSLLNLCINGRDAMAPDGGRLTIETANRWLDERSARQHDLKPGQYVSLCVTDTGTGMSPEVIERAFDPFFTTKPLGRGTGLGLSMVYGFVRQSGGQVRIYSELGEGTTMCLYLPRYLGEVEDAVLQAISAPVADGSGETILVIDDEPTLRMLMTDVLQESGYRVLPAATGSEGLRILDSGVPIDLMVTDVGLPGGINGRQVADYARLSRSQLKILFITGYAENAIVGNGHLEPGMVIMTKPFAVGDFAAKVRDLLDR